MTVGRIYHRLRTAEEAGEAQKKAEQRVREEGFRDGIKYKCLIDHIYSTWNCLFKFSNKIDECKRSGKEVDVSVVFKEWIAERGIGCTLQKLKEEAEEWYSEAKNLEAKYFLNNETGANTTINDFRILHRKLAEHVAYAELEQRNKAKAEQSA